ncbi:UDP-N-acetyl glucosamine 2-epimerase [Alkalispirochaeta sphaeroplastigenens]|uniref:UDP-N-acetyl glucosamine 2-epimerase n=1 Tax=Alkalispirochaeta sphaeroplastigenens TaxID=1187066 RepID=A0A2S4JFP7_9SPIO|nr:UDP-N-acetylglucosamine 2-epimerase (non-hydrolyzing) [Alkalispirochaeta sphaeroplastigenens]POQ98361.1 UDP-N-acetyl glucosamine 2-epimerase [Alkalispirochaeta sphaeroplastigenens]
MKVTTVIGARPQFIKAAVVSRALAAQGISETIIHTGQHFDANMSEIFFDELEIPQPGHNLGIGGGSHGQNTGRMIEAIEALLIDHRPDVVLIYGDTDSTLAGALAAVKLHVPVAHIEAGLRSFNRRMPEEINRILTDHAADLLFAPTEAAVSHLAAEGIPDARVHLVGDVMYDAALFYGAKAEDKSSILEQQNLKRGEYVLATVHRAENTDDRERLTAIIDGFAESNRTIILPLHPRTKSRLANFGISVANNILLIDPVGYLDMVMLEKNAALIATDSGGVQKEAFFYGVPCVTLRDETEWTELVEAGWNKLVNASDPAQIEGGLVDVDSFARNVIKPYGNGSAGKEITLVLSSTINDRQKFGS